MTLYLPRTNLLTTVLDYADCPACTEAERAAVELLAEELRAELERDDR